MSYQNDEVAFEKEEFFSFLDLFFKEIDLLVTTIKTKKEAEKLDNLLPHIFRRWYYTSVDLPKGTITPYLVINDLKEKLPNYKKAEILIVPKMAKFSSKKKMIKQLAFMARPVTAQSMPILQDFYYQQKFDQEPLYQEQDYQRLSLITKKYFVKAKKKISASLSLNCAQKLAHSLLKGSLSYWWSDNIFLSRIFSLDKFNTLFFEFLNQAKKDFFSVDLVFEILLRQLVKEFSFFNMVDIEEEEEIVRERIRSNQEAKMAHLAYFQLGREFDRFFITPLATYLWILEPWWTDRELLLADWQFCFKSIIDKDFVQDSLLLLYTPCSYFKLNSLGQELF